MSESRMRQNQNVSLKTTLELAQADDYEDRQYHNC
jgi:hypothetical protein